MSAIPAKKRTFQKKPDWIKVKLPGGDEFKRISKMLRERNLFTVCEEAMCPNIAECWSGGTATLMIMGEKCTRGCRFCNVKSGIPDTPLDPLEPAKSAETVELMNLEYVVITSVDRDELEDQGASHFAKTIELIHKRTPHVLVETLIPDFRGNIDCLQTISHAKPDVLAHNVETVRRLTPFVRDQRATYDQSLMVLQTMKKLRENQWTKSSIMLGLGETQEELLETFQDLRDHDVDFLTLGQYLQPSRKHLEVKKFYTPEEFKTLEQKALTFGFKYVASGPLVRSSYRAGEFFISNMIKQNRNGQELPVV
ncbi:MAG: lipoyl synthase [Deltaproteobacteria bacterium]|nr:lipoyl synthase [Deltaproteobacteria bacterium]